MGMFGMNNDLRLAIRDVDLRIGLYSLIVSENPGEAFLPLRDQDRFRFVQGDYALIWPNLETGEYDDKAVDFAPECVRFFVKSTVKNCHRSTRKHAESNRFLKLLRTLMTLFCVIPCGSVAKHS